MTTHREALLLEHQNLSDESAALHRVLAELVPQERTIKVETFLTVAGSDKVRTNAADQASLHLTTVILETRHKIDAILVELDNVRTQLAYTA